MCSPTHHYKFCTCNPDLDPEDAEWTLFQESKDLMVFGETQKHYDLEVISKYSKKEQTKALLNDLNQFNCFDFDYVPEEGDYLAMNAPHLDVYPLYFKDGKWVAETHKRSPVLYNPEMKFGAFIHPEIKPGRIQGND